MAESEDLYNILQVHPAAHPEVVRAAYRRLTLLYHPDRNPSPDANEQMRRLTHAYGILGDPEKRAAYDRRRLDHKDAEPTQEHHPPSKETRGTSPQDRTTGYWNILNDEPGLVTVYTVDPTESDYWLVVQLREGEPELFVTWETEISDSDIATVTLRTSHRGAWREQWIVSTDREATFVPPDNVMRTIGALRHSKEFKIEVTPFGGDPLNASFQVEGFAEAFGPVLEALHPEWVPTHAPRSQSAGCGCLFHVAGLSALLAVFGSIWFSVEYLAG